MSHHTIDGTIPEESLYSRYLWLHFILHSPRMDRPSHPWQRLQWTSVGRGLITDILSFRPQPGHVEPNSVRHGSPHREDEEVAPKGYPPFRRTPMNPRDRSSLPNASSIRYRFRPKTSWSEPSSGYIRPSVAGSAVGGSLWGREGCG